MSCYLRHCGTIMEKAGVTPSSKEARRKVDRAMREIMGLPDSKCPEVWQEIKKVLQETGGEERLAANLRHKLLGS